jgi:hypothetical protein
MAQSELNRLLILPAIVLAAALSLSGCANLPFFGNDSGSSNNSSSNDDDDDEDEDDEDEDEDEDEDADTGGGDSSCPPQFLDASQQQYDGSLDNVVLAEINPNEFEPSLVGDLLDSGCFFTITTENEGVETILYNAFVPGGEELIASLDDALLGDGYEAMGGGFYTGTDQYVIVYSDEDAVMTPEQIEEQGLGFLGDEFVVVTAYEGQV